MVVEASSYRATSAEDEAMNKELVTFIYAGQGSEWHGMGVSAYAAGGAFRETIDRLAAQLKTGDGYGSSSHTRVGGRVLADKLLKVFEEGAHHGDCHGIALIAYQLAATNALRAAGVAPPTAVLGYSLGEVAAGYCAGALTESQALAVACARAQLVEEVAPEGAMAVAGLSKKAFNNLCKEGTTPSETKDCYIACYNSPSNITVAGPQEQLLLLQKKVVARGGLWRAIDTRGKAFHSPTLSTRTGELQSKMNRALSQIPELNQPANFSAQGRPQWLSTSAEGNTTVTVPTSFIPSTYFSKSITTPVMFEQSLQSLPTSEPQARGPLSVVYEVGPSSGLLRLVKQTRPDVETRALVKRNQPETETVFSKPAAAMRPAQADSSDYSTVFVFCGEGLHASGVDLSMLMQAPAWNDVAEALKQTVNEGDLEAYLAQYCGAPAAPPSILVTTVINILHASLWRSWGLKPDIVVGHSSGDVAAAHAVGMYSTVQALRTAHDLGRIAASQRGGMLYTHVGDLDDVSGMGGLELAGINSINPAAPPADRYSVTLCGSVEAIEAWLKRDKGAQRLNTAHPWHHPDYAAAGAFLPMNSSPATDPECSFISSTLDGYDTAGPLDDGHWGKWVASPTNLQGALNRAAELLRSNTDQKKGVVVVECGSHPVARSAAQVALKPVAHAASARRGMPAQGAIKEARRSLSVCGALQSGLRAAVRAAMPELNLTTGFAEQGIDSQRMMALATRLQPLFPGISVPDLYAFTSLEQLISGWDAATSSTASAPIGGAPHQQERTAAAMVLATGIHLPPSLRSEAAVWEALQREDVAIDEARGYGKLNGFDAKESGPKLGVSRAEVDATDPQHVLALAVVDAMWTSLEPAVVARVEEARDRVGVYLGVWQAAPLPAEKSAYAVLGCATSALAARVANTYDFHGPAVSVNTACSSSLVAVDMMLKDLRAGRIDYAIVGGVNLLADPAVSEHLRVAKFLSPTSRCHTFSSAADGYVRSEGGVCFLVARDDGVSPCHGLLLGSAINQNSRRKPITSVDPAAQSTLITDACKDAGVSPNELAAVEMHGTGTRLGDPVEITALAGSVGVAGGAEAPARCFLTAAKMHFGHLESAAGGLGLLKALLMLRHGQVPAYSVVPAVNPMVAEAMAGSRLALVTDGRAARLPPAALIGVSSFGFTGSNAHVILRAPSEPHRLIPPQLATHTPQQLPSLSAPAPTHQPTRPAPTPATPVTKPPVHQAPAVVKPQQPYVTVGGSQLGAVVAVCRDLGVEVSDSTDGSASVLDLGIDSLGVAELAARLALPGGVEAIFENPCLSAIAALLSPSTGGEAVSGRKAEVATLDKVQQQQQAPPTRQVASRPAADSLQRVVEVCRDLGVEVSDATDGSASVLDLGIDSLGVAELAARLALPGGVEAIFEDPRLSAIAAMISPQGGEQPQPTSLASFPLSGGEYGEERAVGGHEGGCQHCEAGAVAAEMAGELVARMEAALAQVRAACTAQGVPLAPGASPRLSVLDLGIDALGVAELARRLGLPESAVPRILKEPSLQAISTLVAGVTPPKDHELTASQAGSAADQVVDDMEDAAEDGGWIRVTHVGSLPRRKGASVEEMVAQQLDAGMSVVNDGEMERPDYISDVLGRLEGCGRVAGKEGEVIMPMAADMADAPAHARRFTGINGLITLNAASPARSGLICTAKPKYSANGAAQVSAALAPLLAATKANGLPPSSAFWSVPSPGTLALFAANAAFPGDYTAYVSALGDALAGEYEAVAATGVMLQVDAPDLAMGRHTRHAALSDAEFLSTVVAANVTALNRALARVPTAKTRVHVCWGNYPGPHTRDLDAELLWPHLLKLKARYLLVEMANPRHGANDVAALAAIAPKLGDKVVVPGLVECTNPRVEHPRAIAARLVQLAALVGPHRLMAGTDCGFASTASATAITADIAWLKLAALGEGARMASETLYNASAPARCPLIANHATSRVLLIGGTPSSRAELTSSLRTSREVVHVLPIDDDVAKDKAALLDTIRWRIDWPILAVGLTPTAAPAVDSICEFVNGGAGDGVARRPATPLMLGNGDDATKEILSMIRSACEFDKRVMGAGGRPLVIDDNVEEEVLDVVVVGAGLLGMYAGNKLADEGMNVAVLERRWVTGGVWSLYANATSQVNSSEGGYSVKEMLPGSTPNRDHSPAQEVLEDLAALGRRLGSDRLRLGVTVTNVARQADGSYVVHVSRAAGGPARLRARGVVLAINDRVGVPRQFVPGNASLNIPTTVKIVPGICDATSSVDSWAGKRVVIYGMGAFAVEAARTALEGGAEKVTVVARRLGTVCPKMVDYSNFVSPWDEDYRHDMSENAATMQRWNRLYAASGAQPPACWPGKIKPEGHTISVSDIWFVAHKMGKLSTHVGTISGLEGGDVVMEDGGRLSADVLIPCIGFLRNTALAESLTGIHQVATSNYLDKHLIYLADAEIDDGAFNFFFGSSVLEYAKFYTSVFIEGLRREGELGHLLWGDTVKRVPLSKRVWSQYIATARRLCQADPRISTIARAQVDARTAHFMATLPPPAYEASNRQEWEDMHTTLNGGVPVPKEKQLPYFLDL